MITAGRHVIKGRGRLLMMLQSLFVGCFAPIGACLFFWAIASGVSGIEFSELPIATIPVTVIVFAILAIWLLRQGHMITARATAASRFGRAYNLLISQDGVTLTTDHSRWHSGWHDVEVVRAGKKTLTIGISGIAIPVPRHAFLGPQDADEALRVMQGWQGATR